MFNTDNLKLEKLLALGVIVTSYTSSIALEKHRRSFTIYFGGRP